ncbi:MAG TPA: hypothetical protein VFX16_12255 [Pseudonocardiaceae bacterium]|jgi:hypothetical protein|nr:hypothetical protein [Pseudonocardiaceae bacterium]
MWTAFGFRSAPGLRSLVVMVAALLIIVWGGFSPASADSPGCSVNSHCYSVLKAGNADSTLYAGSYGTWNRAAMVSGCSSSTPYRFVLSTHWFWPPANNGSGWVEAGHSAGYSADRTTCDYRAYTAWQKLDGSGYTERTIADLNHNDDVTDEFQISKSGTTDKFYVYFNGTRVTTADVQFWNSRRIQMGGEVATSVGSTHEFNMIGEAITQASNYVNLPTPQVTLVEDPPLYGNRPANSRWDWRIRP